MKLALPRPARPMGAEPGPLFIRSARPRSFPGGFLDLLGGFGDTKGGMLIRDHVILVFGVDGLMLRWHIDLTGRKLVLAEVLEKVRVARLVHMHVRIAAVLILQDSSSQWDIIETHNLCPGGLERENVA